MNMGSRLFTSCMVATLLTCTSVSLAQTSINFPSCRIKVPTGWKFDYVGNNLYTVYPTNARQFYTIIYLKATLMPRRIDLHHYVEQESKLKMPVRKQYHIISQNIVTVSGLKGLSTIYSFQIGTPAHSARSLQIVVFRKRMAYVFMYVARKREYYNGSIMTFSQILQSVHWTS